jgi:hypothetical protein
MKNQSWFCWFVMLTVVLGGCVINTTKQARSAYCSPFDTTCNKESAAAATSSSASVATTSTVTAQPVSVPTSATAQVSQPAPVTERRVKSMREVPREVAAVREGEGYIATPSEVWQHDIYSVKLVNYTNNFICPSSSTNSRGVPVCKPRLNSASQDVMRNRVPGIPCANPIQPALGMNNGRIVPATFEMAYDNSAGGEVMECKITLTMYTKVAPHVAVGFRSGTFGFPNVPSRTNCMFMNGCFYDFPVEASNSLSVPFDQLMAHAKQLPSGQLVVVLTDSDQG